MKDGSALEYSRATDDIARSFLQKEYSSIEDLNHDIMLSAKEIASTAVSCVPMKRVKSANSSKIHNKMMSHLCWKSRCAFVCGKLQADQGAVSCMMRDGSANAMFNDT